MKERKKYIIMISLILIVVVTLGISYALLAKNISGNSEKIIYKIGDLEVKLDESSSEDISLTDALPTEDSDGLKNEPHSFSLINNAITDLKYTIYLEDDTAAKNKCGTDCQLIPYNFIKYNLSNDSNSLKTGNLLSSSSRLYAGTIKSKSTDKFNLRVWLSIDTDNSAMGKYYFGKLKVVISQGDDYCIRNGFTKLSDCMLVMNDHESTVEVAKQNIVAKGTPDFSKTATTDEGLFIAQDDDGPSYYYRGAVKNNYVSFAGVIWRITRQNGDGSIRMVYAGKTTAATGNDTLIAISSFNSVLYDAAGVGYKYGLDQTLQHTTSNWLSNGVVTNWINYYFSDSYEVDETNKKLVLSGNIVTGKIGDIWASESPYKYTCLSDVASNVKSCASLIEIKSYDNPRINVNYHAFLSKDYASTYSDQYDSKIKQKVDNWYSKNILNKNYDKYLSDNVFCNDRSFFRGDGYSLNSTTDYGAQWRNSTNRNPSYICPRNEDKFTTSKDKGNGELIYPIGLLTLDDLAFAGVTVSQENKSFFLYNGSDYWLGSPAVFGNDAVARAYIFTTTGSVDMWSWVSSGYGVRPVINLSKDVTIVSGDGTSSSPYHIKIDS